MQTMDTRQQASPSKRIPRDNQFVRNYYYDHDVRWIVDYNIPFSYENIMQPAIVDIQR